MPKRVQEPRTVVASRCTPELRSKLEAKAKVEGKTLSTVIYEACIAAVAERR